MSDHHQNGALKMASKNVPETILKDQIASEHKNSMDVINDLSKKLVQLQAMIEMTYCDARESFSDMNETLRDNYMWACSDLVRDCIELSNQVCVVDHLGAKSTVSTIGGRA